MIKQVIIGFFLMVSIAAVIINLPALFQESSNPLVILSGISQLVLNQEDIVKLNGAPDKYIATTSGDSIDIKLSRILKTDGWQFKDRMGAGVFFTRGDETLFGHIRMLTSWFQVVEIKPK
jgi:hypothetical protein